MTLTLLHTSDWHLGAALDNTPRAQEHQLFLDWLLGHLRSRPCDVLLIAGNIFHSHTPDPEDQARLFQFLARAAPMLRRIVAVGGTHDSSALLDASAEILDPLGVTALGDPGSNPADPRRALIPVDGPQGPVAVIAAVPFIHDLRLGRLSGEEQIAAQEAIWSSLAASAGEHLAGLPLVACGHLSVAALEEAPKIIRPSLFSYAAVGNSPTARALADRIRASGAPVPLSVEDAEHPQQILRVTLSGTGSCEVEPVEVPRWRAISTVAGSLVEVVGAIMGMDASGPLPPLLSVEVHGELPTTDVEGPVREALKRFSASKRPRLLKLTRPAAPAEPVSERARLAHLDPEDVFRRLVQVRRGEQPDEALLAAFRSLVDQETRESGDARA